MDKKQAQQQIRDIFENTFHREKYRNFISNLLNQIETRDSHYSGNLIPDAFKDHISQYWRIGKYIDPDKKTLDLLIVEVKSLAKLDRARTALRNFAVNRLKQFDKECSLVAFYSKEDKGADWRFSFIKIEHEAFKGDKGKVKFKTELTPARRYSYLVGEHENSHTAQMQLLDLLVMDYANPTIEQIEDAFSIEKVTKEFFDQYKTLYLNLAEQLKGQSLFEKGTDKEKKQAIDRFAKKLLGQIVFLYFLKKKGWLGVSKEGRWGSGDKRFLRSLFSKSDTNGKNFYNDYLQYLFYEALANERKRQNDPTYYKRFDCRIPFLNGGLFEADYDWHKTTLRLPNFLFSNNEKNNAGDIGTGILDVFDRYNFTIKEDEPLEKEVAVDPEMLGKVFENMLEEIERKNKGAFYTPREIVHYMCQESLINYLDSVLNSYATTTSEFGSLQIGLFKNVDSSGQMKLTEQHTDIKVPKADLEIFVRKGHLALENDQRILDKGKETRDYRFQLPDSVRNHAEMIDEKLFDIKICDPAIGSGAFPVGLLHELVNARMALAPHSGINSSPYELKLHTIRESLYGVDIDTSAIDIARLRLWLSLIVDEDDYSTIEALPNLDYKIRRGNSLIGFPENYTSENLQKIESLKDQFFFETDQAKKAALKQKIEAAIQTRIDNSKKTFGYAIDFDFRLIFSEVWHEKDGFDIVIGNPPYVQIQNFSGQQIQKDWEKQKYNTFAKTGDIYCLFYEKGHRILRNGGALCFITSNKWMRANYGQKLRDFFSQHTNPITLIDFSSFHVFETATVDTNVLIFKKMQNADQLKACLVDKSFSRSTQLDAFVDKKYITLDGLSSGSWIIVNKAEYDVKKKIESVGIPLENWDVSIYRGILTGFNEAFIVDGKTKDALIDKDPKNTDLIKPILRGKDIKRYRTNFSDLWVIFTHNGYGSVPAVDIGKYPVIKKYLQEVEKKRVAGKFGDKAKKAKGLFRRDDQGKTPYNLRSCAYVNEFTKEKIVWGNLALSCQFAIADCDLYINAPSPLLFNGEKYLLAILNSQVGDYYIRSLGVTRNGGYFEYKPMFVEKLPVPKVSQEKKKIYVRLVDYVLYLTKKEIKLQSVYFDQLIDGMVYELYFSEEIKNVGKAIIKHLGELKPIDENMSDEKKLAIIQSEFDRLYDPKHPVRNNLETLDSVDVVRIIRDALRK